MSSRERRQSNQVKTLCVGCHARKARFRYRGTVRADRDHTLCFECYRREVNRTRARGLVDATPCVMPSLGRLLDTSAGRVLSDRQRAHRQRMFDHLHRSGAGAS